MAMGLTNYGDFTEQDNLDAIWYQFNKAYGFWPDYEEDCDKWGQDFIDKSTIHTFKLSFCKYIYPDIWEQYQEDDDKTFAKTALRMKITGLYYNNEKTNELELTKEQCSLLMSMFLIQYCPTNE